MPWVQNRLGMTVFKVEGPSTTAVCSSTSNMKGDQWSPFMLLALSQTLHGPSTLTTPSHTVGSGRAERIARHNQMRPTLFQVTALALTDQRGVHPRPREGKYASRSVNRELDWGAGHCMLYDCYQPPAAEGQGGEGKKFFLVDNHLCTRALS